MVAAVVAVGTTLSAPPRLDDHGLAAGKAVADALPTIQQRVDDLGGRTAHVLIDGDQIGSAYVVGWSMGYGFMRAGFPIHIATFGTRSEYWDYRKYTSTPEGAVRVYIVQQGPVPAGKVPPGATPLVVLQIDGESYPVFVDRPGT